MWRRVSSELAAPWRSALRSNPGRALAPMSTTSSTPLRSSSPSPPPFQSTAALFADAGTVSAAKKRVEDVLPIATGHEREEIEAELEGKKRFDMDAPEGPFGTKEAPAVIQSYYDKRIVGCPGGEGEEEHDVVWFWLEKGKPHECPVCSQYFALEVIGEGGPPDGHGDDHHH
ncbi:putative cytochrome c oxidase subunit 5b-like [Iris pallida]|uniref:Cytochrome c oxidase subunit 5b-like n=1 Tax=Iris pallida TaxID=29817 RepID=A0AAX6GY82_IRIPA|nr:putative cytochrome c oxidase subunit 5b-like [Iris pallida]